MTNNKIQMTKEGANGGRQKPAWESGNAEVETAFLRKSKSAVRYSCKQAEPRFFEFFS
jgi:hypothetical protein